MRPFYAIKSQFIEHLPIVFVGAIINRPPNYLPANNWYFRRKCYFIA